MSAQTCPGIILAKQQLNFKNFEYYYYPFFSKMALMIFPIFCMKLDIDKGSKVTKPDFGGKIWIIHKVRKCGQNRGFSTFSQKWL